MLQLYILGVYFGKFIAGAVVGGIIPLIIAFVKRRWGLGIAAFLLCGIAAFVHPIASIIVGIIYFIATGRAYPAYYEKYKEDADDE